MAQTAVQFESSLEQELMYVVSSVTTRNENFLEMARTTGGQRLTSDKYRVIDEIAF